MSLEPIESDRALELYLADMENEVADATIRAHRIRLGHLLRWCDEEKGIENMNDLTGRLLHEFRLWRRQEGDLAPASEKTQMDTLRVFIRWLESIDGVEENLHTKVQSPSLTGGDNVRDVMLDVDQIERILTYLRKYEYCSRPHVVMALMWHTSLRIGAVRALDREDYDRDEQSLSLVHRPDTGTPLKNQNDGERFVALSEAVCEVLDDWLEKRRPAVTDEYGRSPLITTPDGRVHTSTLRRYAYQYTRPCVVAGECPHDRDPEECPAVEFHKASECPSSVSPHALRRGSITHALSNDWPRGAVSDRANVSEEVLEKHYDQRSEKEKMEQRREYLNDL